MSEPSHRRDARNTGLAIVALLLALVGVAIGLNSRPGGLTPPAATDAAAVPAARIRHPAAAPTSVVLPVAAPTEIVAPAPDTAAELAGRAARADAGTPSTEDVVARAVHAVVLIEAGNSRGTGFFVAADTVVTNVHVVGRHSVVTIRGADGRSASARVTATAPAVDLAVLKVGSADRSHTVLPLGTALDARVGQDVLAIGSALGTLHNTVTRGIVSGVRRSGQVLLLQTDAAVNPGNSGGPLIDGHGVVLGITTMGYVERQGLNFAVAADHARALVEGQPLSPAVAANLPPAGPSVVDGLSPAPISETDQARDDGQKAYDDTLQRAAADADGLDVEWQRYRRLCHVAAPAWPASREWFAVLGPAATTGAVDPGCAAWVAEIRARAQAVGQLVTEAGESARRADVLPGVRRDRLRRYRLDFDRWDP